ncbi:MAG TPA: hypothetical protein VFP68_19935, partial [Burkholderiaceae bacterium]|nr:hypothetical protein [Burkholderiaceae bacterium]
MSVRDRRRRALWLTALAGSMALPAQWAWAQSTRVNSIAASAQLGFERVRLPAQERMGLVGASYVLELSPGWWVGPAVYGAATGQRGGLFTWGAEAPR